ncbi:MAG: response regulator [Acidobacteria bacterium]|nr:response regulator [Acidobacteriota bacterium]
MAKILLADDSGHAQRMGAKILAEEGHEVVTVGNGQAAIKSVDEWKPELVIADIFMPGKNGFEVCQYVKSDPQRQHIPVLLLIGAMEPYDPDEGRKVHADGIYTKPLKPTELIAIVQQLLANAPKPAPTPARPSPPPRKATEEETVELETPFQAVLEPEEEEMVGAVPTKAPEIPQEVSDAPETMYGDLLETKEPEPAVAVGETALVNEEVAEEFPTPEPSAPAVREFEVEQQAVEQAEKRAPAPWEIQTGETLQELVPTAPPPSPAPAEPPVRWTAEAVAVTAQDEKLFEQAAPDWNSLTEMVATEAPPEKTGAAASGLEPFQAPDLFPASEETVEAAPAEPVPVEPAQLAQLVRQSLEEMMPEIVRRVTAAVQKDRDSTLS